MPIESSSKLKSLFGPKGETEPGTKRVMVGLSEMTPIEAVKHLKDNRELMSVYLHELTHFHSLGTVIGSFFAGLAYVSAHYRMNIIDLIDHPEEKDKLTGALEGYVYAHLLRDVFKERWLPLLEGLAVLVQTQPNCAIDLLGKPIETITTMGFSLESLEGLPKFDLYGIGELEAAAHEAVLATPSMKLGTGQTFATFLEMDWSNETLPYLAGYSYLRLVQKQLSEADPSYLCPQVFTELVFKILRKSGLWLLGEGASSREELVNRLYGWTQIISRAGTDRIQKLSKLDKDHDPMLWLHKGETKVSEKPLNEDDLMMRMARQLWKPFHDSNNQDIMVSAYSYFTYLMKISSNGRCFATGIIPNLFEGQHFVSLDVDGHTWWLSASMEDLIIINIGLDDLPTLTRECFKPGRKISDSGRNRELYLNWYVTEIPFSGLPKKEDPSFPPQIFLFEISASPYNKEGSTSSLLTAINKSPIPNGMGVLRAVGASYAQVHEVMESYLESAEKIPLITLKHIFEEKGYPEYSKYLDQCIESDRMNVCKERDQWIKKIAKSIACTPDNGERLADAWIAGDSSKIFIDVPSIRRLITDSYSKKVKLEGPGATDNLIIAEKLNKRSQNFIGKPLFKIDHAKSQIRYIGPGGQ